MSVILQQLRIQQTRPVDDPQDDHPGSDDFEDGPVIAEQQMAVGGAEEFVLRREGAVTGKNFKGADLLFQALDEGGGRIGVVLGDVMRATLIYETAFLRKGRSGSRSLPLCSSRNP